MNVGLYRVGSAIPHGISARPVHVDVHIGQGLPSFTIVGVTNAECRNTRDRVRAAIVNSGFQWPSRLITIAASPSHITTPSAVLDLPIALALLIASGQFKAPEGDELVNAFGELGLDGSVRPVVAHLPILRCLDGRRVLAPPMRVEPSCLPSGCPPAIELRHLNELPAVMERPVPGPVPPFAALDPQAGSNRDTPDQLDGLSTLERALTIAIAGGHHTLIVGSRGVGKSRLLGALNRLVPDLDDREWHEQIMIQSAAGADLDDPAAYGRNRPVRVVDPNCSLVRLVGGMTNTMRPGEFSRAHRGLLVMDDLHLFSDQVLQALATTLDTRSVKVARAARSVELPGHFQLVATAPRCPCGAPTKPDCLCSDLAKARFVSKLTGSLLDRIDVVIDLDQLTGFDPMNPVRDLRIVPTEQDPISDEALWTVAPIDQNARDLLTADVDDGRLSHRGVGRAWRVAQTIHQLRGTAGPIDLDTMLEAVTLRLGNPDGDPYLHKPTTGTSFGSPR